MAATRDRGEPPAAGAPAATAPVPALVDHLFRREAAQLVATLTRYLGPHNLALAEDCVQETFVAALRHWAWHGVPDNPRGWLQTVARNRALDTIRRERAGSAKQLQAAHEAERFPRADELATVDAWPDAELRDDQLRMMFSCCHPALSRESRVALTLKTLGGLSVGEIARAFLAQEPTIAQRLVRAKKTLRDRAIPFTMPDAAELPARLDSVLDALYLLFNEGYAAHQGEALVRQELCGEAIRLVTILAEHPVGDVPKVHALRALLLLQASRLPARTDAAGNLRLLEEQDRTRWDRALIVAGLRALARASQGDALSEYHLQAGIAACHAIAPSWEATDWPRILAQYDDLLALRPSPVVALNRAVALAMVDGVAAGIAELERIRALPGMASYYLLHCTAGEFFRRTGDLRRALEHWQHASTLSASEPEKRFLAGRMAAVSAGERQEAEGRRQKDAPQHGGASR